MTNQQQFAEAKKLLEAAKKVVIISHRSPDGDTVGANLALRLALKHQWNKEVVSACVDTLPGSCDFLPEVKEYVQDFDLAWPDVIVLVDVSTKKLSSFIETKPALFDGTPPVINIDHHASNDGYGKINIVNPESASATHLLYHFLIYCGFKITPQIATCLLNGLYYDTGSFMHSNTTPEALDVASRLTWKGADYKTIARKQFHTMSIQQLKVYGTILERLRVNSKKITTSTVTHQDFTRLNATSEDTTGAVDYLNSVAEGDLACLLYEEKKGGLKGSLRTRTDDVDLTRVAGMFGGGGHKKASGFSLPGSLMKAGEHITILDV
jgi:phosphoesterase RecJ-like protein